MSKLQVKPENHKIFVFHKVFEFASAKQQAEKKKLNAFGLFAKFNPLKRPTDETVLLKNQVLRYEPFWFISSRRNLDYTCAVTYAIPVHNPHVTAVEIKDTEASVYPVIRQQDKAKIDVQVIEQCHRSIEFSQYFDGLKRDMKQSIWSEYIKKFQHEDVQQVNLDNVVQPQLTVDALTSMVRAELQNQVINATSIEHDLEEISALYLYFRPVYAFEYHWSSADKIGVIEVDGLTGEIIENGHWFKETFEGTFTRDNLVELSAELASTVVPGAGTVLKIASKVIS
ncbi:hypothetical protein [Acinetobacter larvae]|uniref:Uncharacterized protein n=1 Tax=Acinetobacter larvae TaxID=1789224 RepID=A0A1B2LYJ5_9GAMM|nr:hypothetical protein [Acinetobacter larvae]AOA58032.1 hypothetical protein BFG52_06480 [Acinetobacter larvae]